jgi:hypothetical protein
VIIPIFSFDKNNQITPINQTLLTITRIEKGYGKENCMDRSEIPPIIIDFDDKSSDEES